MSHVRTQIRDAIVALLTPVFAPVEVIPDSYYNLPKDTESAVLVYANSDAPDHDSVVMGKPRLFYRELTLSIELLHKATAGFTAALDDMAVVVEKALATDLQVGGLALDIQIGPTSIGVDVDGEKPVGFARLQYNVTYRTTEIDPESPA